MSSPLERALTLATTLSRQKRLCTGTPLSASDGISDASNGSFDDLVSHIYRWYWESLREDRAFLNANANGEQKARLAAFGQTLQDQRHDRQHENYSRAADAKAWRERSAASNAPGPDPDAALKNAMLTELGDALQILCAVAGDVVTKPHQAQAWNERSATSPEEEVRSVYRNLGIRPSPARLGYAVRKYSSHPRLGSARTTSDRAQVAEIVVIGAALVPLSIGYEELIDEFGLIGDSAARPLLLLAHGVEMSGHRHRSTVSVLKKVWPIVSATS